MNLKDRSDMSIGHKIKKVTPSPIVKMFLPSYYKLRNSKPRSTFKFWFSSMPLHQRFVKWFSMSLLWYFSIKGVLALCILGLLILGLTANTIYGIAGVVLLAILLPRIWSKFGSNSNQKEFDVGAKGLEGSIELLREEVAGFYSEMVHLRSSDEKNVV